jgi:hypothetical protein
MRGEDDQVVPYKSAALIQVKLLKNPTLKRYPGFLRLIPFDLFMWHGTVIVLIDGEGINFILKNELVSS